MFVRMLTSISGTPTAAPGDIVEMADAEAQRFVDAELAEPIDQPEPKPRRTRKVETASADDDVETATV